VAHLRPSSLSLLPQLDLASPSQEPDIVHEMAHLKNPSTVPRIDPFSRRGVGHLSRVEARPFVADDQQGSTILLAFAEAAYDHFLVWVRRVAVQDRVGEGLAQR
jgi:hypothetical protein